MAKVFFFLFLCDLNYFLRQQWVKICYHIEKKNISLKITCNTPARILLRPYLARGHQCIRKGTSLYTKFSLYSSLNSLFPVTLVSIDMELWLPSRMMTSTFCRFVWFVMYNGLSSSKFFHQCISRKDYQTLKPRLFSKSALISSLYSCNNITTTLIQISRL